MNSVRHIPEPVGYLEDLIHAFAEGARDPDGMHLDAELCRGLAEGLGDVLDGVEVMGALIERVRAAHAPTLASRRTAAERRALAQLAVAVDPDGRIVSFPSAPVRPSASIDGGSAA